MTYTLPEGKSLVLRSNKPDLKSYNDFQWPESGPVVCPDWNEKANCGNGLHGWLWATGDYSLKEKHPQAKWLVVEVESDSVIDLGGKVKFQQGNVIFCGTFRQAYDLAMKWFWSIQAKVNTTTATKEKEHASASGYSGHASASGHSGHASASGYSGHASASGYSGHASASGDYGHASASGRYGAACVLSNKGKVSCGELGSIILTYWDGSRFRHVVGYEGENGIKSGKIYRLNDNHEFEEVTD